MTRRQFAWIGLGGLVTVGGAAGFLEAMGTDPIKPTDAAVRAAERRRARAGTGNTVRQRLVAKRADVDLGGRVVTTSTFDGSIHGPVIRAKAGDRLEVMVRSELADDTSIHWHGLAIRNDMDGAHAVTGPVIAPSANFLYHFIVPDSGTYWYHPHVGTQLDTGLYGPLIVDGSDDAEQYDVEAVLMLDDWIDGWGDPPDAILRRMRAKGMRPMGGMEMDGMDTMPDMDMGSGSSSPLGQDTGDVKYPAHLINGRLASDPPSVRAIPGQKVRLRIINAAADTAYRFAVGGHRLTVTHADGFAVEPVTVDTVILGMGERYDVEFTAGSGRFAITASPEGKPDPKAAAVLHTSSTSSIEDANRALAGQLLSYADLRPIAAVRLKKRQPDRTIDLDLRMGKGGREWLINGRQFADVEPIEVSPGERVRMRMINRSPMFHPMHLHGHTFALASGGARKDTVNVLPMRTTTVEFDADNPGQWLLHCHNIYHAELGMMTQLSYVD